MIRLPYEQIDEAIWALTNWLGAPTTTVNGRPIGVGAMSKAKWMGPGWLIWTDHFRTGGHGTVVRAFLSFEDEQNETLWRLKHPEIGS